MGHDSKKPRKDMDRWLGDGGMEIIGLVGAGFSGYGVDGEDLGWVDRQLDARPSSRATRTAQLRPASTRFFWTLR